MRIAVQLNRVFLMPSLVSYLSLQLTIALTGLHTPGKQEADHSPSNNIIDLLSKQEIQPQSFEIAMSKLN